MPSYGSKTAIIKEAEVIWIFAIRIECWRLENSGREDNLGVKTFEEGR
jgi:hypothetical protein